MTPKQQDEMDRKLAHFSPEVRRWAHKHAMRIEYVWLCVALAALALLWVSIVSELVEQTLTWEWLWAVVALSYVYVVCIVRANGAIKYHRSRAQ